MRYRPNVIKRLLDMNRTIQIPESAPVWLQRFLYLAVASALPIATILLLHFHIKADLRNFIPMSDDSIVYWHQAATFAKVGFEGGYYTHNELLPTIEQIHFAYWGPIYPILYGVLGKIFGWGSLSILAFNLLFLTAALFIYLWVVRPNTLQVFLLFLFLLTSFTTLIYIPLAMQESLHNAIAIVMATIFFVLFKKEGVSYGQLIGVCCFIVFASLIRYSWALLLVPGLLFMANKLNPVTISTRLMIAGGSIILVIMLYDMMAAPYPFSNLPANHPNANMQQEQPDMALTINRTVISADLLNKNFQVYTNPSLNHLTLYSLAFFAILTTFWLIYLLWKSYTTKQVDLASLKEVGFYSFSLTSIFLALLTYISAERIIYASLMMFTMLLISHRRYILVGVVLGVNLMTFPTYLEIYERWMEMSYHYTIPPEEQAFQPIVERYFQYEPNVNVWCNTLLMPEYVNRAARLIPAGIGYSIFRPIFNQQLTEFEFPLKSRYIVMFDQVYRTYEYDLRLLPVELTPYGYLFYNLDTPCEIPTLDVANLGLLPETMSAYEQYQFQLLIPPTAEILSPNPENIQYLDPLFIGAYMESRSFSLSEKAEYFDLMYLHPQITFTDELDLDSLTEDSPYLLLSEPYWRTTKSDVLRLEDLTQYRLIQWWDMGLFYSYYLYEAVPEG